LFPLDQDDWRCAVVVFLTGASGFIGSRIAQRLSQAGHQVVCAVRNPRSASARALPGRMIQADFARDLNAADWEPRLLGVDVVVNAVGILRETDRQRFNTLHVEGPRALFDACLAAGVRRIVQISALGADADAVSRYHLTKKAADDYLLTLPLSAVIVQPSLVYGAGGKSARLFTTLASLPLIPLPGRGDQLVQPLHIDDAVQAIVALVQSDAFSGQRVALVGPQALSLRSFLVELRGTMGLEPPHFLSTPIGLVRVGARVGGLISASLLDNETLQMLERGNTASAGATEQLLGHLPRPPSEFIDPAQKEAARALALTTWLLPLLRLSVAAVWIVSGIVSLGLFPISESYLLLARVGIGADLAPVMFYGAALLDVAFGVATLALNRRWLWLTQIAVVLGYSAIITLRLPEFWLHPFGPLVKNLPLLAVLYLLLLFAER
jgi:nucleoside-diphosphate-sugar epimerase